MSLLADIFQKQQQIAQNPASVVRTPQQQAYDNLLNRQYDIEQQNKKYNTFNGIMSGAGGLGKIIASAFVKNPYQQAGAMEGIGQQEQRLDNLRQAYENLRNSQNKDYVAQAKEQLDMANADEEKAYNKNLTEQQNAYKKMIDELAQKNKDREFEANNERWNKEYGLKEKMANAQLDKINAEITALQNKPEKSEEDILKLQLLQEQVTKAKRENDPEYLQQQQEQAIKQEQDKQRQKQLETYVGTAKDLFNKGLLSNEDLVAIEKNPELAENLIPAKARMPITKIPLLWDSSKRVKIDKKAKQDFQILKDANGNMAKVYKDGRIEEL